MKNNSYEMVKRAHIMSVLPTEYYINKQAAPNGRSVKETMDFLAKHIGRNSPAVPGTSDDIALLLGRSSSRDSDYIARLLGSRGPSASSRFNTIGTGLHTPTAASGLGTMGQEAIRPELYSRYADLGRSATMSGGRFRSPGDISRLSGSSVSSSPATKAGLNAAGTVSTAPASSLGSLGREAAATRGAYSRYSDLGSAAAGATPGSYADDLLVNTIDGASHAAPTWGDRIRGFGNRFSDYTRTMGDDVATKLHEGSRMAGRGIDRTFNRMAAGFEAIPGQVEKGKRFGNRALDAVDTFGNKLEDTLGNAYRGVDGWAGKTTRELIPDTRLRNLARRGALLGGGGYLGSELLD